MAQAGAERSIQDALNIWITPEVIRRQDIGLLPRPFPLVRAQVLFSDSAPPIVRLNDEVKLRMRVRLANGKRPSSEDSLYVDDIDEIEELELVENERDFGHITIQRTRDSWVMAFDASRNRAHAVKLLSNADEFLRTARFCHSQGMISPCLDNLFNSSDLLARAVLFTYILPIDTKGHDTIHAKLNQQRKLGNVDSGLVDLFNRLFALKPALRAET